MNLIIYGNSGSGKTTLARLLSDWGYCHINTGKITRLMAEMDCHNLPLIVQQMIASMDRSKAHVFDHFYIHTYNQLVDLDMDPVVIILEDRRSITHTMTSKRERFLRQHNEIETFLSDKECVTVYNTDWGFDVSELIRMRALPFECKAVLIPKEDCGGT